MVGTCTLATLATLPRRLLLWLSQSGWLLWHKASNARTPPTQSPIRQTWVGEQRGVRLEYPSLAPIPPVGFC